MRILFPNLGILFILFFASLSQAEVSELLNWFHAIERFPVVVPKISRMSADESLKLYVESLKDSKKYHALTKKISFNSYLSKVRISKPVRNNKTKILIVANRPISNKFPFYSKIADKLVSDQHEVRILPIGLDLVMRGEQEKNEFFKMLKQEFDSLVFVGGGDIHPALYGQSPRFNVGSNFARDQFELELLAFWYHQTNKPLFGICRGHQLVGVFFNGKMIQDIEHDLSHIKTRHREKGTNLKGIDFPTTSQWHDLELKPVSGSLFTEAFMTKKIRVNSRHHQAVQRPIDEGKVHVIAEVEGIIEILELKGHRGFSVQFHPEDMGTPTGDKIMAMMQQYKVEQTQRTKTAA
ncbi:MAG: gamma-glutamyl-gamma-aminobutyrate hydrolase family protein [Oligoflexales bacterium]|nr:gamma-glutamyl-gamma-aminobutyrate hydrolase family protein [Oligoflexales bacterium]